MVDFSSTTRLGAKGMFNFNIINFILTYKVFYQFLFDTFYFTEIQFSCKYSYPNRLSNKDKTKLSSAWQWQVLLESQKIKIKWAKINPSKLFFKPDKYKLAKPLE